MAPLILLNLKHFHILYKIVCFFPDRLFAAINNLSEASFRLHKLTGFAALSVDKAIIFYIIFQASLD